MKSLIITLYKSEIIFDVENKTYLTSVCREETNNLIVTAEMKVNSDSEHRSQILRSIGGAYGELILLLGHYISVSYRIPDNKIIADTSENAIEIKLWMPGNFNDKIAVAITTAAHNYIVNKASAEWFILTKPNEATPYITNAEINAQQIREAINKRTIPVRKKNREPWNTNN